MISTAPALHTPGYNIGSISSLVCWYDSSRQTESDDATVATYTDRSPNGHDATQSTDAKRANIRYAELNGHPVLEFDNTDDYYVIPAAAFEGISDGLTVFAVVKKRVSTSKTDVIAHWDIGNAETEFGILHDQDEVLKILDGSHTFDDGSNSGDLFQIITVRAEPSVDVQAWYDGVEVTYGALENPMTFPFTASFTNNPCIGDWYEGYGLRRLDGKLAELVVFSDHLTDQQINWVHKAMARKWGLTITEL